MVFCPLVIRPTARWLSPAAGPGEKIGERSILRKQTKESSCANKSSANTVSAAAVDISVAMRLRMKRELLTSVAEGALPDQPETA